MSRVTVPVYANVLPSGTIYTVDDQVLFGIGSVPLTSLTNYARGSIIRGGAADWEAYDAKTAGALLVGDGVDLVSTVNPTLTGTLTLPNAGLHLLDTDASHDLIIRPGSDLTIDRTLTLTTGDAARTITLSGNPTLDDWFDQSVKQAASPTFADVFVPDGGTFGIAGNELLTVNAAGTFVFSGIVGVAVEDGDWVGIGAAAERIEFYTAGYVSVMGANLGVGTATPSSIVEFDGGWLTGKRAAGTIYFNPDYSALGNYGFVGMANASGMGLSLSSSDAHPEYLMITFSGNLGINETAPDRRLHTRETSASTNVIVPVARFESEVSGGVGAASHGAGVEFYGESDTTTNQAMGLIAARWSVATHASRRGRFEFRAWYIGSEVLIGVVEAPTSASVDGNPRGAGAVDWQGYRSAATQVASGVYTALGGGFENTVSGDIATIPGGYSCLASGDNSFAAGYDAHATDNQSFVLSATNAQTVSWGVNTFATRCHGGARFYSAAGVGTGVQLTAGGNAWAGISDRNVKENFRPVEGILGKIALLPIYDYNLKSQSADIRHIGPVSQDFNSLFEFTEAPLRINMSDFAGVGLAGVKALHVKVVALQERVRVLEAQLID